MFKVSSYIFLYRKDAWVSEPYLISAARRDLLRSVGGELRLVKRSVSLDQSVITSANLATFL
jgi:hypothetical protein